MFIFGLILSILCLIFCIFWLKRAKSTKEKAIVIFDVCGCFLLLLICIGGLILYAPS